MKQIKIAILGMGTVGSGVYKLIEQEGEYIAHKEGIQIEVKKVLALDYAIEIPDALKAANIDEIVSDAEIDVVVEVMGGIEPAKAFMLKAFAAGKSIVSANKQLIASHWPELEAAAKAGNANFYFEASVGGGIPLLRTIRDSLHANTFTSIHAIINGTTNYILTKMTEEGKEYDEVLKEAQALGYAEADPTADVDGFDSMYKLSILASLVFHSRLPIDYIYREGIRGITKEDIQYAKELGYVIKLLAIGKRAGNDIELRVHPTMLPKRHSLASVNDSFNAVLLDGSAVGEVMLYGRGAGDMPTASAVVSDVIHAGLNLKESYVTFENVEDQVSPILHFEKNWNSAYYFRLRLLDIPGTLSKVTKIMGDNGISISSVMQKEPQREGEYATVIFLTHNARELDVKQALLQIQDLEAVHEVGGLIRVEN